MIHGIFKRQVSVEYHPKDDIYKDTSETALQLHKKDLIGFFLKNLGNVQFRKNKSLHIRHISAWQSDC